MNVIRYSPESARDPFCHKGSGAVCSRFVSVGAGNAVCVSRVVDGLRAGRLVVSNVEALLDDAEDGPQSLQSVVDALGGAAQHDLAQAISAIQDRPWLDRVKVRG